MPRGDRSVPEAIRFPHFYIALEAALSGIGALVAPLVLVEELVKSGQLVEPWPRIRVAGATYSIGVNPDGPVDAARRMADWLVDTAEACRQDVASRTQSRHCDAGALALPGPCPGAELTQPPCGPGRILAPWPAHGQ